MKGTKLYYGLYVIDGYFQSSGTYAQVYSATHRDSKQRVAVKIANNGHNSSITKEAHLLANFDHDHIVRLIQIPRENSDAKLGYRSFKAREIQSNPTCFVMEFLEGGDLESYLKSVGTLSISEASSIMLPIIDALLYVYGQNYVHNDLKLENIVFRTPVKAGHPFDPVLIDFGIATEPKRKLSKDEPGSLYIVPPEILSYVLAEVSISSSEEQIDREKVDVWGVGIVLYRMLSGCLPFDGTKAEMIEKIINEQPASLQTLNLPSTVDSFVLKDCLAKNPKHRPSLAELKNYLTFFAGENIASKSAQKSSAWARLFRFLPDVIVRKFSVRQLVEKNKYD